MAGGLGVRLRPLTLKTPKPALIVKGKPIIRHVLDWLEDVGFDVILVKLYYLPDQIKKAIGKDENVRYIEEHTLTPTGYFLKKHADRLEEAFLVTNGDTLTNLDLVQFIELHLTNNNIATVFTHDDAIHTGGTYLFDKEVLKYVKKGDEIPDLMKTLVEQEVPMNLFYSNAKYFDTGNIEKLEKARRDFKR